jgi:hypothetical protein
MSDLKYKKKDQTGIEPVTLGPAIPRSTPELLILVEVISFFRNIRESPFVNRE